MLQIDGPSDYRKRVKFKDGKREELIKYLDEQYTKCIADRRPLIEKCKAWSEQANSRRKRPDASPDSSDVDMPLTRKRMTQNSARLKNPLLQQETFFATRPRNAKEEAAKLAKSVEKALDYMVDRIDVRALLDEWIEQFQVFPFGVIKTPFVYVREKVNRWQEIDAASHEQIMSDKLNEVPEAKKLLTMERDLGNGEIKYYVEIDAWLDTKVGCFPEVVPFEDFIVPMGTKDIESADIIFHRIHLSKQAVKDRVREGIYDKEYDGEKVIERIGKPSEEPERLMLPINAPHDSGEMQESNKFYYGILETYVRFDVDGDDEEEEILVTYEPKSKTILRADYNGFHSYRRPFIVHQYKKVVGSIFGDPLTFMLEPLHVANSASVNQRLDAASLANKITLFVPEGSKIQRILSRGDITASVYEIDFDPSDIFQFAIKPSFNQLPDLEMRFEQSADEIASLNPYSFGREQSERPVASGMITIIEESKQPQYDMLESFRGKLSLLAKHMLSRYKQFYPEGLVYYTYGNDEEDNELLKQVMQWPDGLIENDVIIETRASSSQMSKTMRKQEVVALMDKLPQYQSTLMGLAQAASDVMNPAAPVAGQLLMSFWAGLDYMLKELEVPNKDVINPNLGEALDYGKRVQQEIMGLRQENMQLKGILTNLQGGTPNVPAGVGGPELPGQPQQAPGV